MKCTTIANLESRKLPINWRPESEHGSIGNDIEKRLGSIALSAMLPVKKLDPC